MNNLRSEYLGNGNGHANGNGNSEHKKAFVLAPAPEDTNAMAPRLRQAARNDPDLSDGAKVLFDHLTDLSFLGSVSPARGVVKISKQKLAGPEHLQRSERTIRRKAVELEKKRYIWTQTKWEGGFEITFWYIRGMANSQSEFWNNGANPSFGSAKANKRRFSHRGSNGQFCPAGEPDGNDTGMPEKSGVNGQPCPETSDNSDRGQRSIVSRDNGQSCPLSADNSDRGHGTTSTEDKGQSCPPSTDKTDRLPRSEVSGIRSLKSVKQGGVDPKRLGKRAGAAQGKAAPPPLTPRQKESENDFLAQCEQTFGAKEMKENGGLWRLMFRQNRAKAQAVLHETRACKSERPHTLKTTWAQFAMDLWQSDRLKYDRKQLQPG